MAKIPFDIKYRPQIESGEYSYEELCDYYATSYLLPQVISQAQFCQALEEYAKEHPDDDLQHDIERITETVKQEEDAIISYEELMQKKDSIKTIDEEDAIISIEELRKRKQEEDKLYNITKDEEDDEFINELKHFRSDL